MSVLIADHRVQPTKALAHPTQLEIAACRSSCDGFEHTDCMAKDLCLPDFSLPSIPGQQGCCTPGSGCC